MANDEDRLMEEIIKLSNAFNWNEAKGEWVLDGIYFADKPAACLCGESPIVEVCVLKNKQNNNTVEVENVCVSKFLKIKSDDMFRSLEKIISKNEESVSAELIERSFSDMTISAAERRFYFDIRYKRELTPKRAKWKREINLKIIKRFIKK